MNSESVNRFIDRYEQLAPEWAREYLTIHKLRFKHALKAIPEAEHDHAVAIELGTYGLFPLAMVEIGGYSEAHGTTFDNSAIKTYTRDYEFDPAHRSFRIFDLDLERESLPVADASYDFVICSEVIEHMATDPMAMLWETNRILKIGGRVLITTPNAACAPNVKRILEGNIATSYYFYRKTRTADRHNIEYSAPILSNALESAGFQVDRIWTEECWEYTDPKTIEILESFGYPTENRGDNLFALARKIGPAADRFPAFLYD